MTKKSEFCITRTNAQAIEIAGQLKNAGFRQEDISSSGETPARSEGGGARSVGPMPGGESKARGRKMGAPPLVASVSGGNRGRAAARSSGTGSAAAPTQEEIAARAYQNYLKQGRTEGRDLENWLEAEAQLKAERSEGARMASR